MELGLTIHVTAMALIHPKTLGQKGHLAANPHTPLPSAWGLRYWQTHLAVGGKGL